jgi:hypothetical protein
MRAFIYVHTLCRYRLLRWLKLTRDDALDALCHECRARFDAALVGCDDLLTLELVPFA